MRLAEKYNRVNLVTSLIILLLTGGIYYLAIHFILTNKVDNDLRIEEEEIIAYAGRYKKLPFPLDFKDQKVSYRLLKKGQPRERYYLNAWYLNTSENEKEPGRSLLTSIQIGPKIYEVTITKSKVEAEYLVRIIFLITLGVIAILLISLIIVNHFLLNRLWRPFYAILKQLKVFNLADKNEFIPEFTKIEEFEELNRSVLSMARRAKSDYKELRSFTDNASHEMMTPLAVINSKLDSLIQMGTLSDMQGELIQEVYHAVSRLSRLNQSLLLLTKIENNLINDNEQVDISQLIRQKIKQFSELLQSNSIVVEQDLVYTKVFMSKYLADILLNNLISNAIKHNNIHGTIKISFHSGILSITNTGFTGALDSNKAFDRFYKGSLSEGTGLGLAISRQICNLYHFKLLYRYQEPEHIFSIDFGTSHS